MLSPPSTTDLATPAAAARYWSRAEAAAVRGDLGPGTAGALLLYALEGRAWDDGTGEDLDGDLLEGSPPRRRAPPSTVTALAAAGGASLTHDADRRRSTPLHCAARIKDGTCAGALCGALVAAGGAVNAVDSVNRTPLHVAATLAAVRALLDAGADASLLDLGGKSVLFSDTALRDGDACRALIAAGAPVHVGQTPSPRPGRMLWHPLHLAKSPRVVEALVEAGASVAALDTPDAPLLYLAASHPDHAVCEALLAAGANPGRPAPCPSLPPASQPESQGPSAGTAPTQGVDTRSTVRYLEPLLNRAACAQTVHALLAAGADVHASAGARDSPLFSSAATTHPDATSALLAAGCSVGPHGPYGPGLLSVSRSRGVVEVLLAAGAPLQGSLTSPVASRDPGVCRLLLEAGADPSPRHQGPLRAAKCPEVWELDGACGKGGGRRIEAACWGALLAHFRG
jgi:ankyrin repeat protein